MLFFLIWIACAVIVGAIARAKDRSFLGFFLISAVFSPLIGLIVVLVRQSGGKKCPSCVEKVKLEAKKCRHCGHKFSDKDEPTRAAGLEEV